MARIRFDVAHFGKYDHTPQSRSFTFSLHPTVGIRIYLQKVLCLRSQYRPSQRNDIRRIYELFVRHLLG
jgi:dolichyl-phosphate-mannose--protein O-mannosyl transferase